MGVMHEMLKEEGDLKSVWDKSKPAEVAAAKAQFDALIGQGYQAFNAVGENGEKGKLMKSFDPNAERIILAPPLQGG